VRNIALIALCALCSASLRAHSLSRPLLQSSTLRNGMELHVLADSSASLARVQIVFRAGAIAQSPETAGLFHLVEHMIIRGNAAGKGSSLRAALAALGASEWNGGTSSERVSFWLTLPSSRVEEAIEFWADALRSPLLSAADLEAEKEIVAQEIKGRAADPDVLYEAGMDRRLLPKYPWRKDPAGSEKAVRAASIESVTDLYSTWFVPNNASLFVGGDIDPASVTSAAIRLFGDWKAGEDPWRKGLVPQPRVGLSRPAWLLFPDASMPEGIARVEVRYRGPDLLADPAASLGGDLWNALVSAPGDKFKTAIAANVPGLLGAWDIRSNYEGMRDGSTVSISARFETDPSRPAVDRARAFKERFRGYEITAMRTEPGYFSKDDFDSARRRIAESRALALDEIGAMIEGLASAWASSSVERFVGYGEAIANAGRTELLRFLDSYILKNLEVVALRMNPLDIEKERLSFEGSGFETLSAANAFWWQR
jgi:zinc protease